MGSQADIRVYYTANHPCGYWPDRDARDLVLDPADPSLPRIYGSAVAMGFRRSGNHVYRPHCSGCTACTPVRIPTERFVPSRSQRRCAARNADLELRIAPALRTGETFDLYRRYVAARHAGGGMDDPSPADFDGFLSCKWSPTEFLELRKDGELLAVAVTDVLPNALSAVYTFYAPGHEARSLGTFGILSQLAQARRRGLANLYLGFWIEQHPKMDYKRAFRPLQRLVGSQWLDMASG